MRGANALKKRQAAAAAAAAAAFGVDSKKKEGPPERVVVNGNRKTVSFGQKEKVGLAGLVWESH